MVDKLFEAFTQSLNLNRKQRFALCLAALSLGVKRVQEAKKTRALFP